MSWVQWTSSGVSGIDRDTGGSAITQLGQHLLLGHVGSPGRAQLEMRLIDDGLSVAAPFEAEVHAECADCFVFYRLGQILRAFEYADVEGDAEVVV